MGASTRCTSAADPHEDLGGSRWWGRGADGCNGPDSAVVLLDARGHVSGWNPVAAKLTGYFASDILGWPHSVLYGEEDGRGRRRAGAELETAVQRGSMTCSRRLVRKEGRVFPARILIVALSDRSGNVVGFSLFLHDLSVQRRLEERIDDLSRRTLKLFNELEQGLALLEPVLDERGLPVDYRFLSVSPSLERMADLRSDRVARRLITELIGEVDPFWIGLITQVPLSGAPAYLTVYSAAQDRHFEITAFSPVHGLVAIVFTDVTGQVRAEDELTLAARVFEDAPCGLLILNAARATVKVNASFVELTGYALRDIEGKVPPLFSSPLETAETYADVWRRVENEQRWQGELVAAARDGTARTYYVTLSSVTATRRDEVRYVCAVVDVTQMKDARTRLEFLACHDAVTGLPNRHVLQDRLRHAIARAQRDGSTVAVLFIDVDRFKGVNDTLGHLAGDVLLRVIAERLRLAVRDGDTVSRIGGDEFVVLLENPGGREGVADLIARIGRDPSPTVELREGAVNISCSIGVAMMPEDGVDAEGLVHAADAAMYRAKEASRHGQ